MKQKGFTIIELIATLMILAIVITITILSINAVAKKVKENQRSNLISVLRVAAKNYKDDTGIKKVYVDTLIKKGYTEADETDKAGEKIIKDPVDNSSLNCYLFDFDENQEGDFLSGDCSIDVINNSIATITYCTYPDGQTSCVPNTFLTDDWIIGKNIILGLKTDEFDINASDVVVNWISPFNPDVLEKSKTHKVKFPTSSLINDIYSAIITKDGKDYDVSGRVKADGKAPIIENVTTDPLPGEPSKQKILTFKIVDNETGIAKYAITNTASAPAVTSEDWISVEGAPKEYEVNDYKLTKNGFLYVWAMDKAGNVNIADNTNYVIVQKIDNVAPKCKITGENTNWVNAKVRITWGCEDEGDDSSGCTSDSFIIEEYENKSTVTKSYIIRDKAGNSTTCSNKTANVYSDTQAPTCGTISGSSYDCTRGSRTVSVACNDSLSGCRQTSFSKTTTDTTDYDELSIYDKAGNSARCSYPVYVDNDGPIITDRYFNMSCSYDWCSWNYGLSATDAGCGGFNNDSSGNLVDSDVCYYERLGSSKPSFSAYGSDRHITSDIDCDERVSAYARVADRLGNQSSVTLLGYDYADFGNCYDDYDSNVCNESSRQYLKCNSSNKKVYRVYDTCGEYYDYTSTETCGSTSTNTYTDTINGYRCNGSTKVYITVCEPTSKSNAKCKDRNDSLYTRSNLSYTTNGSCGSQPSVDPCSSWRTDYNSSSKKIYQSPSRGNWCYMSGLGNCYSKYAWHKYSTVPGYEGQTLQSLGCSNYYYCDCYYGGECHDYSRDACYV